MERHVHSSDRWRAGTTDKRARWVTRVGRVLGALGVVAAAPLLWVVVDQAPAAATAGYPSVDVFATGPVDGQIVKLPAGGGSETPVDSGLDNPRDVGLDAAGDLFVLEYDSPGDVVEIPAGGGSSTVIVPDLFYAGGIGVDGAGDLVVADGEDDQLVVVPSGGTAQTISTPGLSPADAAIAPDGTIYFVANQGLWEVPLAGGTPSQVDTGDTNLGEALSVALDGTSNVYVGSTEAVLEVPAGGGSASTVLDTDGDPVFGVAADAGGDVFASEADENEVIEVPAGGTPQTLASDIDFAQGVAVVPAPQGPPPGAPESPVVVALPVLGTLVAGLVVWRGRARPRRAAPR